MYTAWNNGTYPVLNSSSKSDESNIVLTGSGYQFTSGMTANVSFMGIWADTVSTILLSSDLLEELSTGYVPLFQAVYMHGAMLTVESQV
jgi:hypothetical protein